MSRDALESSECTHRMANHRHGRDHEKEKKSDGGSSAADLLLHPELLSNDFIKLILHERNIQVDSDGSQDQLTDLYMRHVIPLPQRDLPNSRWGRKMQKTRVDQRSSQSYSHSDASRKRPLIVFDGSSTGSVKLKKPDALPCPGATDRLKPPPSMNLTNPIRKLAGSSSSSSSSSSPPPPLSSSSSSSSSSSTPKSPPSSGFSNSATSKLKRPGDGDCSGELRSPEVKKKIQHVTWP